MVDLARRVSDDLVTLEAPPFVADQQDVAMATPGRYQLLARRHTVEQDPREVDEQRVAIRHVISTDKVKPGP